MCQQKKQKKKRMLSLNQSRAVFVLVLIGLIFMLIALIHLFLAMITYKRKGAFLQSLLIGLLCLVAGGVFIDNDIRRRGAPANHASPD